MAFIEPKSFHNIKNIQSSDKHFKISQNCLTNSSADSLTECDISVEHVLI